MSLDYLKGGLAAHRVFDTNGNGTIDDTDTLVGGFQVGAAIGGTTFILPTQGTVGVGVISTIDGNLKVIQINFGPGGFGGSGGRFSWRELFQ